MNVTKRDATLEPFSFDKITSRVKTIGACVNPPLENVNYSFLVMKVIEQLYDGISTTHIDELTSEQSISMITMHPDYGSLAARIAISNHQKQTPLPFSQKMQLLHENGVVAEPFFQTVVTHAPFLDSVTQQNRDFLIDFFGFKTLEKSYLMKLVGNVLVEGIQDMFLRVAVGLHGSDLERVVETYELMSTKCFIHATPTLFNSGTKNPQLSSCFLLAMEDDSIGGIYKTLSDCADISKWSGGIGLHIHNIRAKNAPIRGTNGQSSGLVPMMRVFNETARFVNQGGKRNGSIAVYLEPWHADICEFLELKKNHGDEDKRARDLFYGLWIPDLFMRRVETDQMWTLFCPLDAPLLANSFGTEFDDHYAAYEAQTQIRQQLKARDLWFKILDSQMETGTPYILFKDAVNNKSNQKNVGVIKSSNLCCEITLVSNEKETAVCNLASIALPSCFLQDTKMMDYEKLHAIVKVVVRNLNKVIDKSFYPARKTKRSNFLHRPIGVGVQGLANLFFEFNVKFCGPEARKINKDIFETMYHAALEASLELAKERSEKLAELFPQSVLGEIQVFVRRVFIDVISDNYYDEDRDNDLEMTIHGYDFMANKLWLDKVEGYKEKFAALQPVLYYEIVNATSMDNIGAYSSFVGSPLFNGKFQFDLWNEFQTNVEDPYHQPLYDWVSLRRQIMQYGIRNSTLLAPMPTASTSQILGFNECFEPTTSNIYTRRTLAGEFIVLNLALVKDLIALGKWSPELRDDIILHRGSVSHLKMLPVAMREKYQTVWEMSMKDIIDMAADRGRYICQSQSMNLWVEEPNYRNLSSTLFYAWKKGLKTGLYYLRRKAKGFAQQFTISPSLAMEALEKDDDDDVDDEKICVTCSA